MYLDCSNLLSKLDFGFLQILFLIDKNTSSISMITGSGDISFSDIFESIDQFLYCTFIYSLSLCLIKVRDKEKRRKKTKTLTKTMKKINTQIKTENYIHKFKDRVLSPTLHFHSRDIFVRMKK